MISPPLEHFLIEQHAVFDRLRSIDPQAYDRTRNHLDGATTWLGPFLTHGVISTRDVADAVLERHRATSCYRLLFELAWREFFHRTWQREGDAIFGDLRADQPQATHDEPPAALLDASTGITAIDECIRRLLTHGTLHNHARLWIAAIACNLAHTRWPEPARWLHHHLLDGDLASNTLSWQWVAGTFSDKRYVANQENVNRFAGSSQHGTWLDVPYEQLERFSPPDVLRARRSPRFDDAALPGTPLASFDIDRAEPLALRSIWHLDPRWRRDIARHIVFIDTDLSRRWPMSTNRWRLIEHWSAACNASLVHGTVDQLAQSLHTVAVERIEYPACTRWPGIVQPRDWLYPMPDAPFPSFSRYWKQVRASIGL